MDYLLNKGLAISYGLKTIVGVLNLIINGLPSKLKMFKNYVTVVERVEVLNLIINGLPSKLHIL